MTEAGWRVPFNRPLLTPTTGARLAKVLERGQLAGDGDLTAEVTSRLVALTGARSALLTTSCTHALEMAALLLDVGPGDEVIVPSFTFVSVANAVAMRGATPVFADVRVDDLNIDAAHVESLCSSRTRAIIAVHYGGVACDVDALTMLADTAGASLVEDCAHALFAHKDEQPLGSFGRLATLSFHETKNITCGEGGALLINDEGLLDRAEIIRNKGTNRNQFLRGQVDKYTWVDLGSSWLPSEILAAVLVAQLAAADDIQNRRRRAWQRYRSELNEWADRNGIALPPNERTSEHPAHLFWMMMPTREQRSRLIDHLRARGVMAVFHYQPLHLSPMGRRFGGAEGQCPISEQAGDRLVRLPLFSSITDRDTEYVLESVTSWASC